MKKYRKYIIAVMTVLLIAVGLTACGKSTAQDLQSHHGPRIKSVQVK